MDFKEWLIETKMLLALDACESDEEDLFKIWFEQGYSPRGAAYKYKILRVGPPQTD